MTTADLVLVLHVLLFVTWLGIDVGVFAASFLIRKRGLSPDARTELRRLMRGLDLAPRLSLVLMIPTALSLAHLRGFQAGLPAWLLWTVAVVGVLWCLGIIIVFRARDPLGNPVRRDPLGSWFGRADLWLRLASAGFFVATGAWSLGPGGPWISRRIALKALIFGFVVLAGLWIRISARDFAPALREVVEEGETEGRLQRMDMAMYRTYPAVLTVWTGVLVLAVIGLTG